MTTWQWQVIMALVRLTLFRNREIVKYGPVEVGKDLDLLQEAIREGKE